MVRMVTGDNLETAVAIAKQCGILKEDDGGSGGGGLAMEGSEFRKMTPKQLDQVLPKLQVLVLLVLVLVDGLFWFHKCQQHGWILFGEYLQHPGW